MSGDTTLRPGQMAPEFSLLADDGRRTTLADFRGRRVIVYFYPAAGTRGCTEQACDFRDRSHGLDRAGVCVVGISPDPPGELAAFREAEGLDFTLLSDSDAVAARAYGAYGEKTKDGRRTVGVIRSTFVVAADGTVEVAEYGVRSTGHVAGLMERLAIPAPGA